MRRGIAAATATEAGLLGTPDTGYIEQARRAGHVIVTHDSDFLEHHRQGVPHAGIVYCSQGSRSIGQVIAGLVLLHAVLDAEAMVGQLAFL